MVRIGKTRRFASLAVALASIQLLGQACGKDAETPGSETRPGTISSEGAPQAAPSNLPDSTVLDGTWSTDCLPLSQQDSDGSTHFLKTLSLNGTSFELTISMHGDAECGGARSYDIRSGRILFGATMDAPAGAQSITWVIADEPESTDYFLLSAGTLQFGSIDDPFRKVSDEVTIRERQFADSIRPLSTQ